jgi:hypothetical protein
MKSLPKVSQWLADQKLEGNIIPLNWFKVIGKTNRYGQFKANLLAINILAELVYWYRPVAERDETTGNSIGYRVKFAADKYQFSYRHAKEKFGASKKSVKQACDLLIELGASTREFRHLNIGGVKYGNVMFMEPCLDWLVSNTLLPKKVVGSYTKRKHPASQKGGTNTETSTENSTEVSLPAKAGTSKGKKLNTEEMDSELDKAIKHIEEKTGQTLKADKWLKIWFYNAVKEDGLNPIKIAIDNFCHNEMNRKIMRWDWISFFKIQAKRANFLPRKIVQISDHLPSQTASMTPEEIASWRAL